MVTAFATNMFGESPQTTAFAGNNDTKQISLCMVRDSHVNYCINNVLLGS